MSPRLPECLRIPAVRLSKPVLERDGRLEAKQRSSTRDVGYTARRATTLEGHVARLDPLTGDPSEQIDQFVDRRLLRGVTNIRNEIGSARLQYGCDGRVHRVVNEAERPLL